MRPARKQPKVRLNLDVPVEVKEQIEALRDRMHADSMTEVIRRALAICDFMLTQREQGIAVVLRTSDGTDRRVTIL